MSRSRSREKPWMERREEIQRQPAKRDRGERQKKRGNIRPIAVGGCISANGSKASTTSFPAEL